MSDQVSNSVPPQAPVVIEEAGWTSVSNSVRSTEGDPAPEPLAPKQEESAGDELVKVEEPKPKAEAKAGEAAAEGEETPEQKRDKRKERSRDRVARIRAEIAAATKDKYSATAPPAVEPKAEAPAPKVDAPSALPKPSWPEFEAQGKSHDEYLDARDAYNRQEWAKEVKTETVKETDDRIKADAEVRAQAERNRQHQERVQAARTKFPDFDAKIAEGLKDIPGSPFFDALVKSHEQGPEIVYAMAQDPDTALLVSQMAPPRHVFDLVRASETPAQLLEYFADEPEAYEEVCRLHPIKAAKRVALIEASIEPVEARALDGSRAPRRVSQSAPPIRPIGGTRTAASSSTRASADSEDILAFIKNGNREEAKRRGYR